MDFRWVVMTSGRKKMFSLTDISSLSGLCQIALRLPVGCVSELDLRCCSLVPDLPPHMTSSAPSYDQPPPFSRYCHSYPSSLSSVPKTRERFHTAVPPLPRFPPGPVWTLSPGIAWAHTSATSEPHPAPPGSSHILFTRFQLSCLVIPIISNPAGSAFGQSRESPFFSFCAAFGLPLSGWNLSKRAERYPMEHDG
jgi:hypothetical protein